MRCQQGADVCRGCRRRLRGTAGAVERGPQWKLTTRGELGGSRLGRTWRGHRDDAQGLSPGQARSRSRALGRACRRRRRAGATARRGLTAAPRPAPARISMRAAARRPGGRRQWDRRAGRIVGRAPSTGDHLLAVNASPARLGRRPGNGGGGLRSVCVSGPAEAASVAAGRCTVAPLSIPQP